MDSKVGRRELLIGGSLVAMAAQWNALSYADEAKTEKLEPDALNLDHEKFMRSAIKAAKNVPNCPFGAVVVNITTNTIIAEGWNRTRAKNPIWHGEMSAINNCPDASSGFKWDKVCIYTTGEPCPMCMSAIIWTGMPLVVYGSDMPLLDKQGFGQLINYRAKDVIAAARCKPQMVGGVLQAECDQLFIDANKLNSKSL